MLKLQTVPFTFVGGLNSKTDQFQLTNNQLLQADNVRFTKDGAVSKRPGFTNLSTNVIGGGTISSGVALQVFNDELLAFDGTFVYSYVSGVDAWVNRGLAISVINQQRKIINTRIAEQNNPDGTNLDGLELYVWEDTREQPTIQGAGIRYSLLSSTTGSFVVSDQFLYPFGVGPKTLAVPNSHQFNIYYLGSFDSLLLSTINTGRPNILSDPSQVIADGLGINSTSPFAYDASLFNGSPIVAYGSSSGLKINYLGVSTLIDASIAHVVCVGITVDSRNTVWVVYSSSQGTFVMSVVRSGSSWSTAVAPSQITSETSDLITCIEDIVPGKLNVSYQLTSNGLARVINATVDSAGRTVMQGVQRKVGIASKPFRHNNQLFLNTIFHSTNQATYFTLCLTQGLKAISKINPQVGGTYRTNNLVPQCDSFADGQFMFANQKKGAFTTNNNTTYSLLGVNASYLQFNNINAFNSRTGANNLHIVGGIEKVYDTVSVVENNFHLYAENSSGTGCTVAFTSGTGGLSVGQYQYIICNEWTDNYGQVQRGQPSIPTTYVNAITDSSAELTIPTLPITDKTNERSPVSIAVFRNIQTAAGPSNIFYKITNDSNPVINDVTQDTVSFIDRLSDQSIAANEPLYTLSQLPNSAPPACSLISNYQLRLMLSGMEDPNVIWTSQDRFELDNYNTIPVEFSPLLVEGVDPVGDKITAIHVLDQALIIFKNSTIFYLSGSGPNALGTAGAFNTATKLPSDAGCINPNSIVEIPGNKFNSGGLMYQSTKGIYLLDRGYTNTYIGASVEQYNSLTITAAELLDDANEVVFTTLQGICLVYNYYFDRWTTWSYLPAVDSVIWQNQLVLMQANGQVLRQTENVYTDYASNSPTKTRPIVRTVQTPWLAFGGLQGFQAVFWATIIGHYLSPHILNLSVCYNYNPSPKEPVSINSNLVSNLWGSAPLWGSPPDFGGGIFTPYQFQYNFGYPWCQSLSLIISDNPLSGNDQGGILSALTFQAGVFADTVRLPARNKVSGAKNSLNKG